MIDSRNPEAWKPTPFKVWHADEKDGFVAPDLDQFHRSQREVEVAAIRNQFTRLKAQLPQRLQK